MDATATPGDAFVTPAKGKARSRSPTRAKRHGFAGGARAQYKLCLSSKTFLLIWLIAPFLPFWYFIGRSLCLASPTWIHELPAPRSGLPERFAELYGASRYLSRASQAG